MNELDGRIGLWYLRWVAARLRGDGVRTLLDVEIDGSLSSTLIFFSIDDFIITSQYFYSRLLMCIPMIISGLCFIGEGGSRRASLRL